VVTGILGPALRRVLEGSAATILLIGRDSDRFRTRLIADSPEYAGRIRATGTIDMPSIVSHVRGCDLMLQPFPDGITVRNTSALLSLACGVPLVTNRGPLTEQAWLSSGAVFLADSHDPVQLGDRVLEAAGDPALRRSVASAGRHLYNDQFDIRRAVSLLKAATVVPDRTGSAASHVRA
jgi:glycosyltransferase involved in cell wall biosynthesis